MSEYPEHDKLAAWNRRTYGDARRHATTGARAEGGFAKQLAYLGGHPAHPLGMTGTLVLLTDRLQWISEKREIRVPWWWGFLRMRAANTAGMSWEWANEPFEINVVDVVEVDAKTKRELQKAPQGYLNVFGIVGHGYHQDEKHPLGQMHGALADYKLLTLLAIRFRFRDEEHTAVFVNHPRKGDETLRLEANAILAAAHAKRAESSVPD